MVIPYIRRCESVAEAFFSDWTQFFVEKFAEKAIVSNVACSATKGAVAAYTASERDAVCRKQRDDPSQLNSKLH